MGKDNVVLGKISIDKVITLESQLMSTRKLIEAMRTILHEVENQVKLVEDELHIIYTR